MRRNGDAESDWPARTGAPSPDPNYSGPPPTVPPPSGWHPPVQIEPPPPRELPPQDHVELDAAEQSAQTLTYGVGVLAGAVMLIVICALCSRMLF